MRLHSMFLVVAMGLFASLSLADSASLSQPTSNVTRIVIDKSDHTMTLFSAEKALRTYRVALGPGGPGYKTREGDSITPVGHFHVTMHQPSQYKLFLRLDYPTATDWQRFSDAKQGGTLPKGATIGGDIGIHGTPNGMEQGRHKPFDWTLGCIAVDDAEIFEIARLVKDGTSVDIED